MPYYCTSDQQLCFCICKSQVFLRHGLTYHNHGIFQGLVKQCMNKYNKAITDDQTEKLLRHTSSENPLWVTVACEELCLFDVSQEIDEKIECLPEGLLK